VRLVAAKKRYVEGDKAEVLLQSPVVGVQALWTFEGEKVLSYRLVDVKERSAVVEVPIEALYAPNVTMKVAVPAGERLLEAEDEVVVLRFLDVSVTASKATAAPGEDVEFAVTTRDAAGNPVPSEVGIAVVDEALFQVAPDRTPAIRPFFYDRKRANRVATGSSVGFKTYGVTRETNKDVLANAAAQGGDAQRVFAQSALRLAREARERGDWRTAVTQVIQAAQADPSSWDARALLVELSAKEEAKGYLNQEAGGALKPMASLEDVRDGARKSRGGDEKRRGDLSKKLDQEKDKEAADRSAEGEDERTEEALLEVDALESSGFTPPGANAPATPAPTPVLGIGGGAGGPCARPAAESQLPAGRSLRCASKPGPAPAPTWPGSTSSRGTPTAG
jgi:hypothetical protein